MLVGKVFYVKIIFLRVRVWMVNDELFGKLKEMFEGISCELVFFWRYGWGFCGDNM